MLRPGRIVYFTRTRLVITAVIVLLIGGLLGIRTLASFTAKTTNPGNVFGNTTITMTNVAGTVVSGSQCNAETYNGNCATLFDTDFVPGMADDTNTVTITYLGRTTTGTFGLYADSYNDGTRSSAFCTATTPADQVQLQIMQGDHDHLPDQRDWLR